MNSAEQIRDNQMETLSNMQSFKSITQSSIADSHLSLVLLLKIFGVWRDAATSFSSTPSTTADRDELVLRGDTDCCFPSKSLLITQPPLMGPVKVWDDVHMWSRKNENQVCHQHPGLKLNFT